MNEVYSLSSSYAESSSYALNGLPVGTSGQILQINTSNAYQLQTQLNDVGGTASIDFENRIIYDDGGSSSISYNRRELTDINEVISIDYGDRYLAYPDGAGALNFATQNQITITGSLRVSGSTEGGGSGHILTYNTSSGEIFYTASSAIGGGSSIDVSNLKSGSFGITIDGGGGVITVGQKGYITVPYNGTITDWEIFADQAGTCNIDVRKSTYSTFPTQTSITCSAPITMSAVQKESSSILTGWVTASTAGDVYGFTLNSATSITRLNLIINVIKS